MTQKTINDTPKKAPKTPKAPKAAHRTQKLPSIKKTHATAKRKRQVIVVRAATSRRLF